MIKIFTLHFSLFFFCIIISTNSVHSQIGGWAWIKGDSTVNNAGFYGMQGIASPLNKPGTRDGSCSWTHASGNLWMFGGEGLNIYNDLWNYNIFTNEWTWMKGDSSLGEYGTQGVASLPNNPRRRHGAVTWTDNSGNLWLFGGYTDTNTGDAVLNDLWKYNIASNEWTWVKGDSVPSGVGKFGTKGVSSITNNPMARKDCISWNDNAGNLWLFGGFSYLSFQMKALNDLWKYNLQSNEWTWVSGDSTADAKAIFGTQGLTSSASNPGARFGSVSWAGNSGFLWLFGGRRFAPSFGSFNDVWKYNLFSNEWTWMKGDSTTDINGIYGVKETESALNNPGSRAYSVGWTKTDDFWLFGGGGRSAAGGSFLNDLWKYNIVTNNWTWIKGDSSKNNDGTYGTVGIAAPANNPGVRQQSTGWKSLEGDIWLFGGVGTGAFNDLWRYTPGRNLPVTLISFIGHLASDKIELKWQVVNEQNLDRYEVERSFDGGKFTQLNIVKASNAGLYRDNDYTVHFNGTTHYYRLKLIDKDGSYSYSPVLAIQNSYNKSFTVYPNPTSNNVQLQLDKKINGRVNIEVTDVKGTMVIKKALDVTTSNITLPVKNLLAGTYIVKLIYKDEQYVQRVLIVK